MRNAIFSLAGSLTLLAAPVAASADTYGNAPMLGDSQTALTVNAAAPAASSAKRVVAVETWIEEWDEGTQSWVRINEAPTAEQASQFTVTPQPKAERYYAPAFRAPEAVAAAQYGPFKVIDDNRVALVGPTDGASPQYFDMMLKDFPFIGVFEIQEGPGTSDDVANLTVGRKIREAGMTTHIGRGGSARSGAVELFLAGADHSIDDGAEFAVHSWRDNFGREPKDYAADAPENRFYLDYYEEMGMSDKQARAFYDMTNSVPHVSALWLDSDDMRQWVDPMQSGAGAARAIEAKPVQIAVLEAAGPVQALAEIEMPALELAEIAQPEAPQLVYVDVTQLDSGIAFP
ncbi:MAG: alpha/beta hydrolase [Erythrobacter sp.]